MHSLLKSICNEERYRKCEVYDQVTGNVQEKQELKKGPQKEET